MPSWPGVFPVMAQAQPGTVMGGVMLARSPCIPRAISSRMFGTSSARSRKSNRGVAQSRPITATLGPCALTCSSVSSVGRVSSRKGARPAVGRAPEDGDHCTRWPGRQAGAERPPTMARWMAFLRRILYLQAAVFFVAGVQAIVLAMFMGLVAQRSEQVWWWSWTFVIVSAAITIIAVLNALFGLHAGHAGWTFYVPLLDRHGSSTVLWWLLAAVNAAFTLALLWGLGKTGQERPLPQAD